MKDLRQVIQRPVVTEKSTIEREQQNIVTFAVHPDANKHEIRRAVEELFSVKVLDVRTNRVRGKSKRVVSASERCDLPVTGRGKRG